MTKHRVFTITVALCAALSLAACGATRRSALETTAAPTAEAAGGDYAGLMAKGAAAWMGRSDRSKIDAAIEAWKAATAADPAKAEPHVHLSRALYFLADGHLRFEITDEDERRTKMGEVFGEGQFHGESALLIQSTEYKAAREAEADFEESIRKLGKESVPAVYWWATNLGKWAAAEGFITLLAHKDQVFSMMTFCMDNDSEFFYSAPHRYFGAFYTKIPLPSGDQEKSRKHFDTAVQEAPNYLATRVLMCEYHGIKFQDRAMCETNLKYVMDAKVDVIPELEPEAVVEKKKAAKLLAELDDYFE